MNACMDGCTDARLDSWLAGWGLEERMDACMHRWIVGIDSVAASRASEASQSGDAIPRG